MSNSNCFRKRNICWEHNKNNCPKSKGDCQYAHGIDDILSPTHACDTRGCPNRSSKSPTSSKPPKTDRQFFKLQASFLKVQSLAEVKGSENKDQRKTIKTLQADKAALLAHAVAAEKANSRFYAASESESESESEKSERIKKLEAALKKAVSVSTEYIQHCNTLKAIINEKQNIINQLQDTNNNQHCDDFQPGFDEDQPGM